MSETANHKPPPSSRRLLLSISALVVLILLLAAAAYSGYLFGKSGQTADISPITPAPLNEAAAPIPSQAPPTATATIQETATQTQMVEKIAPSDIPEVSETAVPTVQPDDEVTDNSDDQDALDLSTFYEVWGLVEDDFDGQLPDDKDLLYGAIIGSLNALDDPYTRFIRPEIAERLRDDLDGSISGIGAIVRPGSDGFVEIVRPIDGQPAEQGGLLSGDLIIAVDGQSVENQSFDEVLLQIRGPEGTEVVLTVVREGAAEPLEFELVRAEFEVPVVESELLEEDSRKIAYVKLSSFTRSAETDLTGALTALLAQEPEGIILDLRDNGGGFLDQAVAVADLFLTDGVVLYERSRKGELDEIFYSESGDLAEDLPLVVLVNAGSASASEILAGAVQDTGRGTIVGEPTFGKGSVQHVHTLSDGSELRVTIARWFTPGNRSISEEGIFPDVEVQTPDDLGGPDDQQLQQAIEILSDDE
jgi:carboxyl-terminal processing protease